VGITFGCPQLAIARGGKCSERFEKGREERKRFVGRHKSNDGRGSTTERQHILSGKDQKLNNERLGG